MNILIAGGGTGGHLMPALAIADAIVAVRPDVCPVMVGARRGLEATLLPTRPYRYHLLHAEPIYRRAWWRNARWCVQYPRLVAECRQLLRDEDPGVVVGTGGYAAGPVCWYAARRGVPLVLQEQNAFPGITTRRLARRAAQIHLGFPEARRHLRPGPQTAVYDSGNPVTPPGAFDRAASRRELGIPADARVVLVTGGSQGAAAINTVVAELIGRAVLPHVVWLWATGRDHYPAWRHLADPPRVILRDFWDPMGEAYAVGDLVVSRSGAMTMAELTAWGLPAVLIPLPTAAANHQTANAEAMAEAGAAVHIPQRTMTADRLGATIQSLLDQPDRLAHMAARSRARGRPDAARTIAEHVIALL